MLGIVPPSMLGIVPPSSESAQQGPIGINERKIIIIFDLPAYLIGGSGKPC
jgi:hypothetical protein